MIRRAVLADLPDIERVMRASMAALGGAFYGPAEVESATRHIAVADRQLVADGTYFVVEVDGRIIACGGWSGRVRLFTGTDQQAATEGFVDPASGAARIRAMFVDPAFARRGWGRRILERAEEDARAAGFRRFELMATLPGVPLYRVCGYEEIERTMIELPDGTQLEGVRMGRDA